jgi:hypothetical protein
MKHFINLSRVPMQQQDRLWSVILRRIVRFIKREKHPDIERARIQLVVYPDGRKPGCWEARLRIRIASDLLTVQVGPSAGPETALREAFDGMERRVREHLRGRQASKRARRRSVAGPGPNRKSELLHYSEDPGLFLCSRRNLLKRLTRNELRALEEDDCLPECPLSLEDVVDESLLRAWDRYGRRPTGLSIEEWLLRVVREVLREAIADREACEPTADAGESVFVEEEDPRRDVDRWCDGNSDPIGLALWEESEAA